MSIKGESQKVKATSAKDAWWYEDKHHIDVIVQTEQGIYSVRIARKPIADWIERSAPK